jgi:transposase InsO family protein
MQYKRDLEKIRRWCIRRKLEGGWKVTDICKTVHISRMSFYRYWKRYKKEGFDGLKDRSKRPHTIHRTDKKIEQKVVQLRKKYQYCPHKIQGTLANQYKIKIGHMTIYRILCKIGLNNHPISKPRKKRKYIRFERKFPNELWQIDLKVIENEGIWLISIFDDHSRYVLSSIQCIEGTSDKIIYLLKRTIRKYGKPLQILTDHGSQFYNSRSKLQSNFDSFCKEHDIQHIMGRVGKPTTLGKIERWHRTYDVERPRFKRHEQFIKYYNNKRVHMSLNYMTPVHVYKRGVTHVVG